MRSLIVFCLVTVALLFALPAQAAREVKNISTPAISADGQTVYFSLWGDIWSAPRDGNAPARRLTDNVALESRPIPSPDGKQIAFLSDRYGSFDIFVMPAEGGVATRLTFDDGPDQHYNWKPDGTAVLAYLIRQDQWGYCGYEIQLDGSEPVRVTGPDYDHHVHVNYLGDDKHFIYSRGPGNWAQKRYRGSRNYDLWTYDSTTGRHTELTNFEGKDCWPQPSPDGKVVYFVSDRDGTENLWRLEIASGELKQMTRFKTDGPRWPRISSDGDEIACDVFGELFIVPTGGGTPEQVKVTIADDFKHEMHYTRDVTNNVSEYAVSPNGKYVAVVVYGDIFLQKNPDSYDDDAKPDQNLDRTRALVTGPGREFDINWHPDSTKLAYASDRDGQYDIYVLDLVELKETRITDRPVEDVWPQFAPKGNRIAYYSGNRELRLYDLDSDEDTLLVEGTMKWGPWPQGFTWAPDGYWFVYADDLLDYQQELYLMNIEDRVAYDLTKAMDWNGGAIFSPDGKYVAYTHSYDAGADIMLVELDPEKPTYDLDLLFPEDLPEDEAEADEEAAADDDESADENGDEDEEETEDEEAAEAGPYADLEPLAIDLERIHLRAELLTGFVGNAGALAFDPDSAYILFETDHTGETEWWTISLEDRDPTRIGGAERLVNPQFSEDGKKLYYLDRDRVGYFEMNGGGRSTGSGGLRFISRLDYDQYTVWEQILEEGWRVLDQSFYDPEMGGVDWDDVLKRYLPRVRELATVYEYGTLYREMLGELGRSHVGYWGYGDEREGPTDTTGDLGVYWDEGYDGPGWRVERVIPDGPATVPGAKLYPGDVLLAIDDVEIAAGENHYKRLMNLNGQPLKVLVQSGEEALAVLAAEAEAAEDEEPICETREIKIMPVSQGSLRQARYELWVEDNRQAVYEMSDGRVGYQHIQRMYDDSAEKFRRELFTESYGKDALIIDVRFNGGGHTAVDVMDLLNEPPAYLRARRDDPVMKYGRQYVWQGEIVVLTNAYSFSNAEIFAHIMKDLGLATIIGEATPGGVISTSSMTMLDGSGLGIPSGGNWRLSGEDMEGPGAGVVPDIEVLIDPQALAEGHDNQLETAVEYLLEQL